MSLKAHLLVTLITLSSWLFIARMVRVRQLRAKYALLWLSIGTIMVVLAASPSVLDEVSAWLGVSYPPATLFLAANALLFLISIHFSWELSRMEERARRLAEEFAIFRAETSASGARDVSG